MSIDKQYDDHKYGRLLDQLKTLEVRNAELKRRLEPFAIAYGIAKHALGDAADASHLCSIASLYVKGSHFADAARLIAKEGE